jgi:AhpD family alkylhydroperoxidase
MSSRPAPAMLWRRAGVTPLAGQTKGTSMGVIMIRGTRRAAAAQVRHVAPVRLPAARGQVATVYAQIERDFGMLAPPLSLHSPAPGPLAACWLMLRETLLAKGAVDRVTKEVVATAVSLGNTCPYCVDVHGSTLLALDRPGESAAIVSGRLDRIADPDLRDIAQWARASGNRRAIGLRRLQLPPEAAAEIVGVAVVFHYINRMVNLFLAESPFPAGLPTGPRAVVKRVFGRLLRPMARSARDPGDSLDLLPAAPLAEDLAWAAGSPTIGAAFARAAAAIDGAGGRSVPASVRHLVESRLSAWDGAPVGPSRAWLAEAVSALPAADRPAGRLAMLAGLASYQLTGADVDALRAGGAGDRELIEIASWASMSAARRVGAWSWAAARG